jgi:L-alanine-DL-glutamate epimerase-like enolase superfamily enzyme
MKRRNFLSLALGTASSALAKLPSLKIKSIKFYETAADAANRARKVTPLINQSTNIVVVETDSGLTGIGEGGIREIVDQCAAMLIGEDASRIDHHWQTMFRGYFYPAGREKLHSLGAIDMALWDLKAKALDVPLYQLIGGRSRDHIECYATGFPWKGTHRETARACVEAGYRAYRIATADGEPYDRLAIVDQTLKMCREVREGAGKDGGWAIDFHTRLDLNDGVRLANLIEPLAPYFVEDLVRSENPGVYKTVRAQTKVPIAVGEQFGARWDINELVEQRLIDFSRATVPNVGGITEMLKIAALCETHYVGLIPHFTGAVSEAALVHICAAFPGPVLMEMLPRAAEKSPSHLLQSFDFKNGKLWPNDRPGLGVTLDTKPLKLVSEITEKVTPMPLYRRPDGSFTNW